MELPLVAGVLKAHADGVSAGFISNVGNPRVHRFAERWLASSDTMGLLAALP